MALVPDFRLAILIGRSFAATFLEGVDLAGLKFAFENSDLSVDKYIFGTDSNFQ